MLLPGERKRADRNFIRISDTGDQPIERYPRIAADNASRISARTDGNAKLKQLSDVDTLSGAVSEPAWKSKPSYYLVATEDKMIPPPAQCAMAGRAKAQVTEVPGSHAIYVSKPTEIAEIIEKAANL